MKTTHIKNQNLVTDIILTFWFGWFVLGGIAITAIIDWLGVLALNGEEVLVTGSVLGIITGGIATFCLYIMNRRKEGDHFEDDRHFYNGFTNRRTGR